MVVTGHPVPTEQNCFLSSRPKSKIKTKTFPCHSHLLSLTIDIHGSNLLSDFLNVLKKGCWWGRGVLLVHSEIFYVPVDDGWEEVLVRNVQYYITLRTNIWIEAEEPDS